MEPHQPTGNEGTVDLSNGDKQSGDRDGHVVVVAAGCDLLYAKVLLQ